MGLDEERNRKREKERERKLGRKTHLGVESCVQFCRSSRDYSIYVYFNRLGEENCIGGLHKPRNGTV